MAYTSYGTRKALGRRYSTDPALLMEMERLNQQYALQPGREARALQASQFDRSLKEQKRAAQEAASQAGKAGMIGTAGNVLIGAPMMYGAYKTMFQTPPPITEAPLNIPGLGVRPPSGYGVIEPTGIVNPAYVDAAATGAGGIGAGTAGSGGAALQAAYTPPSLATAPTVPAAGVMSYAGPAAAGFGAGSLSTGVKEIGRVATLGLISDRTTRNIAGGTLAGIAAGAAAGSVVPGIGTVIGGILGGGGGFLGGLLGGGK